METHYNMKKIILWVGVLLFLALGSCTETIYEEVIKLDTIYLQRPVTSFTETVRVDTIEKVLWKVDTVEITVVVHEIDTIYQIKTDSIFIERVVEKTIHHWDTVYLVNNVYDTVTLYDTIRIVEYEQRVIYESVQYLFPGQSVFYIPDELKPYYDSFIQDAAARGVSLPGGDIVAQWVPLSDIPGEQWVSSSYHVSGFQWVINIWEGLPVEESKAAMYRELARIQLAKKYSNDLNKVMSPLFRNSPDPTVSEINILFQ